MNILSSIQKILHKINNVLKTVLKIICAIIMATLSIVVILGVITRYILGEQLQFTDELSRMLLIILTFFGGALAFALKAHTGLDILPQKLSASASKIAYVTGNLISLCFATLVLVVGGYFLILNSHTAGNELVTMPIYMWEIYLCVPIGGLFASMFIFEQLLDSILKNNSNTGE